MLLVMGSVGFDCVVDWWDWMEFFNSLRLVDTVSSFSQSWSSWVEIFSRSWSVDDDADGVWVDGADSVSICSCSLVSCSVMAAVGGAVWHARSSLDAMVVHIWSGRVWNLSRPWSLTRRCCR